MIQIKVKDLSFSYSGFRALQDISFEAGAGDMLAIIGQNGSGKSTLLKCISRILKINTGHIEIGNISLSALSASKLSRIVAYIPQSTDSISGINVFDTVLLGRKPYIHSRPAPEDMELVSRLLTRLELDEVAMRNLNTLSGGQQQRVFIARALAQQPSILLLDYIVKYAESNAECANNAKYIMTQEGILVIITIHDINMAARFCNKALMLKQGRIFASGMQSVYTPENIENLYDIQVDILRHNDCICIIPQ